MYYIRYNWPPNQYDGKNCIMLKIITYTVSTENSIIEELIPNGKHLATFHKNWCRDYVFRHGNDLHIMLDCFLEV